MTRGRMSQWLPSPWRPMAKLRALLRFCRLLTLHDMPILVALTRVFRVSHGSRTCEMVRTAGSEVLEKDFLLFMAAAHLDTQVFQDTWAFRPSVSLFRGHRAFIFGTVSVNFRLVVSNDGRLRGFCQCPQAEGEQLYLSTDFRPRRRRRKGTQRITLSLETKRN